MKVLFYTSDKPRERLLGEAFQRGAQVRGHHVDLQQLDGEAHVAEGYDMACMVGVKSNELFKANWNADIHTLMIDKGYVRNSIGGPIRTWEYWRIALDAHHPTNMLPRMKCSSERFDRLGIRVSKWRTKTERDAVLFCGASEKYHRFYDLPDPTTYAQEVVKDIRNYTDREIIYRPKPSWKNAVPIEGTTWAPSDDIHKLLARSRCLVTHGSNACFEALCDGTPSIVLGDAIAHPISSDKTRSVDHPKEAPSDARFQLLYNLAHCQWTAQEMFTGEIWNTLEMWLYA